MIDWVRFGPDSALLLSLSFSLLPSQSDKVSFTLEMENKMNFIIHMGFHFHQ